MWQGALSRAYGDRLRAASMADNIELIDAPAGIETRYQVVQQALHSFKDGG
ncbi:hypothetical protein GCM10007052_03090 [Halioglobus japonicus]|nr:hypothetical protein GCM10007052_03090 [Halioglobus japonicus]